MLKRRWFCRLVDYLSNKRSNASTVMFGHTDECWATTASEEDARGWGERGSSPEHAVAQQMLEEGERGGETYTASTPPRRQLLSVSTGPACDGEDIVGWHRSARTDQMYVWPGWSRTSTEAGLCDVEQNKNQQWS